MKRTKHPGEEGPATTKRKHSIGRTDLRQSRIDDIIAEFNTKVRTNFESVATDMTTPKKKNTMTIVDQINSCLE